MKNLLIYLIISVLVSGCTAVLSGGTDSRFNPVQGDVIDIDGYRVYIKIIKVSDSIYDVMASPNADGSILRSELNIDFLSKYSRLRRGAEIILKKQIGKGKEITMLDDIKPTRPHALHMYIRFKVTDKK
jgi:hypothetical protein